VKLGNVFHFVLGTFLHWIVSKSGILQSAPHFHFRWQFVLVVT